jgi:hypothetical protein
MDRMKLAATDALAIADAKPLAANIVFPQADPDYLKMQLQRIKDGLYDLNPKKKHFWLGWCLACLYTTGQFTIQEILQVKRDHYGDPKEDIDPLPVD